jgi:hypothetical protein
MALAERQKRSGFTLVLKFLGVQMIVKTVRDFPTARRGRKEIEIFTLGFGSM